MELQELIRTLPEPVQDLNWKQTTEYDEWRDGTVLFAGVRVRNKRTDTSYWEFAIVNIKIDEFDEHTHAQVTVEDEVWGWNYEDIALYVHIF